MIHAELDPQQAHLQPTQIGPATLYCGDAYEIRPTLVEHNPKHFATAVQRISEAWASVQQVAA